jgi:hypothetical protein
LELPPAITNIPFGDTESELKYLFFVEFFAVYLSALNLPP